MTTVDDCGVYSFLPVLVLVDLLIVRVDDCYCLLVLVARSGMFCVLTAAHFRPYRWVLTLFCWNIPVWVRAGNSLISPIMLIGFDLTRFKEVIESTLWVNNLEWGRYTILYNKFFLPGMCFLQGFDVEKFGIVLFCFLSWLVDARDFLQWEISLYYKIDMYVIVCLCFKYVICIFHSTVYVHRQFHLLNSWYLFQYGGFNPHSHFHCFPLGTELFPTRYGFRLQGTEGKHCIWRATKASASAMEGKRQWQLSW